MATFRQDIDNIERLVTTFSIVSGNFNAHHRAWGGELIVDLLCRLNLVILNDGTMTFDNGRCQCAIDLTLVNQRAIGHVSEWNVEDIIIIKNYY